MRRAASRGQASVEVIALVPTLVVTVLLVWQLAVLVRGALLAQETARAAALSLRGDGIVRVGGSVRVPTLLPGVGEFRVPMRAVVRAP